jgi:hypothetical protein
MIRNLKFLLSVFALLLGAACASNATRFATVELHITILQGTKPAPGERLVVWIEEHRLEGVTDENGQLEITENYPWTAQAFSIPPVGSLTHSKKPTVAVSLASDSGKQFEGVRSEVPEGNDNWKITVRIDLDQPQ